MTKKRPTHSTDSQPEPLLGRTEARIFTRSLPELAAGKLLPDAGLTPDTSYGFDVIDFARDVLRQPLDPWEEWLAVRVGELLPDGTPRFNTVVILVARQNGKTHLLKVMFLYWMFVDRWPMLLGVHAILDYAKKAWEAAVSLTESVPRLAQDMPNTRSGGVLRGNNDTHMENVHGSMYKIAAANSKCGRGLTLDRVVVDELREQHDWEAWEAVTNATNARPHAQVFALSNQGGDKSVVLHSLRESAMTYIETGEGDDGFGWFEWSAPDGSDIMDRNAWAMANPNLGRRVDIRKLAGKAKRAMLGTPEMQANFKTENLCMRVRTLDAAIDPLKWAKGNVPGDLSNLKKNIAAVIDLSPDQKHASLVLAAQMPDGRYRIECPNEWDSIKDMRRELPALIAKIKPRRLGWIPNGPAAAIASQMRSQGAFRGLRSDQVQELTGEVSAICMGFASLVEAEQVLHSGDELLTDHVTSAEKFHSGDTWRFSRKQGQCDAAYAAAGAIYIAQTLPYAPSDPFIA